MGGLFYLLFCLEFIATDDDTEFTDNQSGISGIEKDFPRYNLFRHV